MYDAALLFVSVLTLLAVVFIAFYQVRLSITRNYNNSINKIVDMLNKMNKKYVTFRNDNSLTLKNELFDKARQIYDNVNTYDTNLVSQTTNTIRSMIYKHVIELNNIWELDYKPQLMLYLNEIKNGPILLYYLLYASYAIISVDLESKKMKTIVNLSSFSGGIAEQCWNKEYEEWKEAIGTQIYMYFHAGISKEIISIRNLNQLISFMLFNYGKRIESPTLFVVTSIAERIKYYRMYAKMNNMFNKIDSSLNINKLMECIKSIVKIKYKTNTNKNKIYRDFFYNMFMNKSLHFNIIHHWSDKNQS